MISIGVVSRQTGLDISTLRKWESRYGFPRPQRTKSGQRVFDADDVLMLQSILRRIAAGERVGSIMRELLGQPARLPEPGQTPGAADKSAVLVETLMAALCRQDLWSFNLLIEQARQGRPLREFVEHVAAPLTTAVGDAWASGALPIHAEHFYASLLETLLIRASDAFNGGEAPQLLLITPAGEKHTLGLAMVQAVLAEAGIASLRLFSDLPVAEVAAACVLHRCRAVGVSASVHYPPRLLRAQVAELRAALPPATQLWVGGSGFDRVARLPAGARGFVSFDALIEAARAVTAAARPHHPRFHQTP